MELQWYVSYSMFQSYAQQLADVSSQNGMRDISFLKYISAGQQDNYRNSLSAMDKQNMQNMNGGLIQTPVNGSFGQADLDQIAQSLSAGGRL
jgi:hypothetical protein